jgi:hypothetical protein
MYNKEILIPNRRIDFDVLPRINEREKEFLFNKTYIAHE